MAETNIETAINKIKQNVANAYAVLYGMGAEPPAEETSDNLARTAGTVKVVRYDAQTLTHAQKAQARSNVGAASSEDVETLSKEIVSLTTLPYGGSKEWLESNGDKSKLYQIGGFVWGYVESDGWTQSDTQFLVVLNENEMINEGGTEYLLRNGDEGIVYTYTEASGDADVTVYDSLPETANEGDIVAVGGRKHRASVTTKEVPNYTNLAKTITEGYRISGSSGLAAEARATAVEDYIPASSGDTVYIKGFGACTDFQCGLYSSNKTIMSAAKLNAQASYGTHAYDSTTGVASFTISDSSGASDIKFVRISGVLTGTTDDVVITVNEKITTKTVTTVNWTDIGEYIPPIEAGWNATDETYTVIDSLAVTANSGDSAVYSANGYLYTYIRGSAWMQMSKYTAPTTVDSELSTTSTNAIQNKAVARAIENVEAKTTTNAENILVLRNEVEALGGSNVNETVTIPSYWGNMVSTKTETVKKLQTAGGKDSICFAWASDTHIPDNEGGRTTDIGKVMAAMLDNCEIPFAMLSGDINTRASYSTLDAFEAVIKSVPEHLSPLWGTDRLLMALGNHDGCWGDSTGYYRHQFTPERMWQMYFRGQALDFRRVFSDDGLYFYVDNIAQKTRFIVLNSNFGGEYAEDGNGWAVNNRFGTSCYGQAQLDWFADVALDMPDGYSAIITAHVPPNVTYTVDKAQFIGIVNAYNNKTTYSGSFTGVNGWTSNNVAVDFTNAKGEIIGVFTGHAHGDSIDTTTLACPLLTILSAGASANEPYKDGAPIRTAGTDTETSFDVVTINKATRTIYCTRVGAGSDREVNY